MPGHTEKLTDRELKALSLGGQARIRSDTPKPDLPFSAEEYRDRLRRLRQVMAEQKVDLVFLTAPDTMAYLHGYCNRYLKGHSSTRFPPFTGTAIHVDHDRMIHFDSNNEITLLFATSMVEDIVFFSDLISLDDALKGIVDRLNAEGWLKGTVGMEFWSHVPNRAVSDCFEAAFLRGGAGRVVDVSRPVRSIRRVKSPQEIAYIEEATRIADAGHEAAKRILRPGVTELEAYGELIRVMAKEGGEPPAMCDGVKAGQHLSWHGFPTRRALQLGDLVMWEPYGVCNRYHSTIMRGYYLGDPPPELVKLYRLAGKAYDVIEQTAKAGTPIPELCRELKRFYRDAGIWGLNEWCGGIELGVSCPPDWVGEFVWDVEEETEGVFLENQVTYYMNGVNTLYCDVYVIERNKARRLSKTPLELFAVD